MEDVVNEYNLHYTMEDVVNEYNLHYTMEDVVNEYIQINGEVHWRDVWSVKLMFLMFTHAMPSHIVIEELNPARGV